LGSGGKAMMMHVHYRQVDGEIVGWETGTLDPTPIGEGTAILYAQLERAPDPLAHKVDVATLEIVEKSAAEKSAAVAPTKRDLETAIFRTLQSTDHTMLPDRDDIAPQTLVAWKAYRKALRNLSKGNPAPTPDAMVAAWPLDPNGNDAIAHLRNRTL
jgi:hypothetical protein